MIGLARSWLYVPASDPRLLDKAMAGASDAIVYDIEDSVAAERKNTARQNVARALSISWPKPLWVRINPLGTAEADADIRKLRDRDLAGVRIPKAENPEAVAAAASTLDSQLHLLIESASGLREIDELTRCHPNIAAVSLGEADLKADLRIRDDRALDWARQRVVTSARAAGLPSPVHSVWTDVRDTDGLAADSRRARDHGLFGRSVIHPCQIETVNSVFMPDESEVESARELLNSVRANAGSGSWLDSRGRFVDAAVLAQARWVLDIAESFPRTSTTREKE